MASRGILAGKNGNAAALLGAACMLFAIPGAGLALSEISSRDSLVFEEFVPFTPAEVSPPLARRVAADANVKNMRFTPAGERPGNDRTITIAVRVNDKIARAISVRSAIENLQPAVASVREVAIAPTQFNLGISRGYHSFTAMPVAPAKVSLGVRKLEMPDLAEFRPSEGTPDKPSRFKPRIALETDQGDVGRTPLTHDALGEQSVDVGGAYSISRNLDVTAGVRISQERDRLDPLTEDVQDSQAVYVGTKVRF